MTLPPPPSHSPFGGSVLFRREICPGSYRQEMGKEDFSNDDAKRGSLLHLAVAEILRGNNPAFIQTLNDEDKAQVDFCLQFRFREVTELIEYRLDCKSINPHIAASTLDYAYLQPFGKGFVHDFKFGHAELGSIFDNLQLALYAIAVQELFELHTVVIRLVYAAKRRVDEHVYDLAGLQLAKTRINNIVTKCLELDAPLVPGVRQCKYCKAATTCSAIKQSFDLVTSAPAPENLSLIDLSQWLKVAEIAEQRVGAIRRVAYQRALMGAQIPDYEFITEPGNRTWKPFVEKDLTEVATRLDKPVSDILKSEIISPSQIEAKWGKSKLVREAINPLIERKPGKPKLRRINAELQQGDSAGALNEDAGS